RAGLENVAERYGVDFWGVVRLEELVTNPPGLLLAGEESASGLAGGDRLLSHPVLKRFQGRMVTSPYPRHLLYCGGPTLLHAARYLRLARTALDNATLDNIKRIASRRFSFSRRLPVSYWCLRWSRWLWARCGCRPGVFSPMRWK